MTRTVGTPGQRFIHKERVTIRSPAGITVDEVVFHLDKLIAVPIVVTDGSTGYTTFDSFPETSPATSAFLKMVCLDWPGLEWWFVNSATPSALATQVGPTWKARRVHFQAIKSTVCPFSAASLPAIAFRNNSGKTINAIALYGRFAA